MKYRVLILEDDDAVRSLLQELFRQRGCEVFAYPDPGACPLFHKNTCDCQPSAVCCDFVISDLNMPVASGLDYIMHQKRKGCRCLHVALMTGSSSLADIQTARNLGCEIFQKPINIETLVEWLDQCETQIRDDRRISDWNP
ncbi:MAG: response regulator [bacterium]|nr:response regulator [bacterium]